MPFGLLSEEVSWHMQAVFGLWFRLVLLALIVIPLSMLILDAPVAGISGRLLPAHALAPYAPSSKGIGELFLLAAAAALLFCVAAKRFPVWTEALLLSALAVAMSYYLAEHFLKPLFSRPALRLPFDHVRYLMGWHGRSSSGFPSAHAAIGAAPLTIAALFWARERTIFAASLIVGDALLIVGRWHYVSDVLAGNFLGMTMAMLAWEGARRAKAWQRRQ
ncbi:MAG TPA: phosphatase PAP2 family protein [Rhizomicrobium sp.]|nr:phosphatase PAP2 family protein [Rhizomicrobium sp.]